MERIAWITEPARVATLYIFWLIAFVACAYPVVRYGSNLWLPAVIGAVFGVLLGLLDALRYCRSAGKLVKRRTMEPVLDRPLRFWMNLALFVLIGWMLANLLFIHHSTLPISWKEKMAVVGVAFICCNIGVNVITFAPR